MQDNTQERIQELELDLVVFDEELQVRLETDQLTIQDYYEAMETEEDAKRFPPITVYFDGCYYWLADGRHRYWAMKRRGFITITVKVINGSHDDAMLAAVRLNTKNGLRFKDGDWEKIIDLIAGKDQWKDWSNRKLAEELGCSAMTVQRYRSETSVVTGVTTEKRRGKDGKMYKARKNTASKVKPAPDAAPVPTDAMTPKTEPIPISVLTEHVMEVSTDTSAPEIPFKTGLYCRPGEKPGATGEPYVTSSSLTDLPHDQPEVLVAQLIAHFPRDYARKCPLLILDALRANDGSETVAPLVQEIVEMLEQPDNRDVDQGTQVVAPRKGEKEFHLHSSDICFEPDPDDDYFDWITDEERAELREMQKKSPNRLVPKIHKFTIQNIPEHSPEPLLDCIYTLFKVGYRKKLACELLRRMFDEDGKDCAMGILQELREEMNIKKISGTETAGHTNDQLPLK